MQPTIAPLINYIHLSAFFKKVQPTRERVCVVEAVESGKFIALVKPAQEWCSASLVN